MTQSSSIVRATWLELLKPRRLFPILIVCAALVAAQARFSQDVRAVPLAVLMCLAFAGLAPVAYRVLFPRGLDLSHGAVRLILYAAVGAGTVLTVLIAIPKLLDMGPSFLSDRASVLVSSALFLVGGWGLGRDIGHEQRVAELEREAEKAHLLTLRAHLSPHFLFNTLNAIAEWCRQDGEVAENAVLKLSAMLRAVLEGTKEHWWPLERELELCRTLFELHRMRDSGLFTLSEELGGSIAKAKVPPMSVLTLAENAVKHGPAAGHRGVLVLRTRDSEGGLELTLENPGPFKGAREGSDGLPTLERRLQLAWKGRARLNVSSAADSSRTVAKLWIPLEGDVDAR